MSTKAHKAHAPKHLRLGVLSVSSTRSLADDKSGHWIKKRARKKGHDIMFHQVATDDRQVIANTIRTLIQQYSPHAILITGGTGVGPADVTIEAVRPMFTKELTAFGSLFTYLSYEEIGSAALLSRATAGLIGQTVVFCMPGSLKACKLACKELIFPELGHVLGHLQDG